MPSFFLFKKYGRISLSAISKPSSKNFAAANAVLVACLNKVRASCSMRLHNASKFQQWAKRIAVLIFSLMLLLFVAWRTAIWLTERASSLAGAPLPACGELIADERDGRAAEKARDQIQALMVERQIPGLAAAIAVNGKIVWSAGFRYADQDEQTPACPQTQFRVASVSKLFTAAAMAQLYEQGRLDLDAPIQNYVSSFPDTGHPLTARQLASHRSGIRHYRNDYEALNTKHYNSINE